MGPWNEFLTANPDRVPGTQSRWSAGKDLGFTALRPERVLEVKYDHMEGRRFRHTAHFKRWRTDRDPESCGYAQLDEPAGYDLKNPQHQTRRRTMTETPPPSPDESIHDGHGTYDVVLLVEQALSAADAQQVRSLHGEIEDPVVYHVLLPWRTPPPASRPRSAPSAPGT